MPLLLPQNKSDETKLYREINNLVISCMKVELWVGVCTCPPVSCRHVRICAHVEKCFCFTLLCSWLVPHFSSCCVFCLLTFHSPAWDSRGTRAHRCLSLCFFSSDIPCVCVCVFVYMAVCAHCFPFQQTAEKTLLQTWQGWQMIIITIIGLGHSHHVGGLTAWIISSKVKYYSH